MRTRRLLTSIILMIFVLMACASALFVVILFGSGKKVVAEASKNHIVYGLTLMPSGFDPHVNSSSELGIVLRSVYDTLLYRDPQTKAFVPGLAEKWSISDDGLTYTFNLRAGVKFQDGTPFDAKAVAVNLDRITNPATKSQKALFLLGPYDHYTIVDPMTIQIVLKQPYAPLLDGLSQVYTGIASPNALQSYDLARYQFHQVGTGPFSMVDYIPGDHLTIRRNPDYKWGPPFYNPPTANSVDEIEFRFFTDPATRATALESDAAQIMGELSPTDATLFTGNSNVRLYPQPIPGAPLQFLFNVSSEPTDQLQVRQALIQAINRSGIVDAVFQQFSPVAYGPLSAVSPYYDPEVTKLYPYSSTAALDQLHGLGFVQSKENPILHKGTQQTLQNLRLVMVVPPWGFAPQVAQKLQIQWKQLGADVVIKEVPSFTDLVAALKDKDNDYNLIVYNDFGLDPSFLNGMFGKQAFNNWTHFESDDLDNWLTSATASQSEDERKTYYMQVQKLIMDQALIVPIRDYVNLNGARANVNGLSFDAYGWFPLLPNLTLGDTPKTATPTS
ncbi:MAG: ABC transporter substrate-binding protein [Chloroflexota bacterium]